MTLSRSSNQASRQGFTLLELIIYLALLGICLSAILFIFQAALQSRSVTNAETRLLQNQRLAEATIKDRLARSGGVLTPATGSDTTLSVELLDPEPSPAIFWVEDDRLMISEGGSAGEPLTSDDVRVTTFTATRLSGNPAAIQVDLLLEADTAGGATSHAESSLTFTLRYD